MGRSLIPMTTIRRLIAASRRREREEYKEHLIAAQGGNIKEKAPNYVLDKVDFDLQSRMTKIQFIMTQEYRTIDRYVTKDYVKYPIYSEWKVKSKQITKSIKLTNMALESLNTHDDFLIKKFAEDIIVAINNEELLPSWFVRHCIYLEYNEKIKLIKKDYYDCKVKQDNKIIASKSTISKRTAEIEPLHKKVVKLEKKLNHTDMRIERIQSKKANVLISIFTFGIYAYLISQTRTNRLNLKSQKLSKGIGELDYLIKAKESEINTAKKAIENCEILLKENEAKLKTRKTNASMENTRKISQIKPLDVVVNHDDAFIPLKLFSGFEYEKIIGCYVIHNMEKDKCYVGQSKDVMRRIKQHFKGTVPQNPIFAEDYYTSEYSDKQDLFEIKVIRCETKDELDSTEKNLIYQYDSWNNGYNGTSGNT